MSLLALLLITHTACQKAQFRNVQPLSDDQEQATDTPHVHISPATVTISFNGNNEHPQVTVDSVDFGANSQMLNENLTAFTTRQHLQYFGLPSPAEAHSTSFDSGFVSNGIDLLSAFTMLPVGWVEEYQQLSESWFPAHFHFSLVLNGGAINQDDTTSLGFTIYRIHPVTVCHPSLENALGEACGNFTVTRKLCANTAAEDCPE
jgi:hypothetical protein